MTKSKKPRKLKLIYDIEVKWHDGLNTVGLYGELAEKIEEIFKCRILDIRIQGRHVGYSFKSGKYKVENNVRV